MSFFDDDSGTFDIEAYQHAIRLWTIVLEISVTMAHFPSREIAQGSYDYRTLGLGYANLGSLLMRSGIAYDSDEGRAIAAALTALLTGVAYATSAEMASVLGPFPRFDENRSRHAAGDPQPPPRRLRRAAGGVRGHLPSGGRHRPAVLPGERCSKRHGGPGTPRSTWASSTGTATRRPPCLAPTGTIGLLMDCDTTGVEPDFALVKFKKLAGGGYFKIANQSVEPALRSLGYSAEERSEMVRYVVGTMTLEGAPHIDRAALVSLGLTDGEVDAVERALPGVFELRHAFSPYVIGEDALARLGVDEAAWKAPGFDLLRHLGFTDEQIREAGDHICGRQTIEGAPHLRPEHLPVFDTANRNGRYGTRFIHHTGHIKAMAAVQPFITGAISKTINMPNEATVAEIEEAYMLSWQLGLKAMALYRDGSKASQPLSVTSDEGHSPDEEPVEVSDALETQARVVGGYFAPGVSPSQAYKGTVRPRFVLPSRRRGWTQEARVGGHKIFLRTGEYADGTLGELFIDLAKEGATLRGILSCFAIAVSKGLQYGVPLEEFVDTFTFHTFEPRGIVEGHPNIKMANSIVDYVFRALGLEYLGRTDLVQVPPADERELPEPPKGLAVDAGLQLSIADAAPSVMEQTAPISHPAVSDRRAAGHGPVAEGNGHRAPTPVAVPAAGGDAATAQALSVQWALGSLMGGAPLCATSAATSPSATAPATSA